MKLTTRSRYAVRALANLARRPPGKPVPLSIIAREEKISLNFLEQIFMSLRQRKIIRSIRGPAGGYLLDKPADRITAYQILVAVGEPLQPVECIDDPSRPGRKCPREKVCLTRETWQELGDTIALFLKSLTLAHIIDKKG
jgi:Rrf2 family iron-sulfur cluster assembly transcriptional regulator